MSKSCRLPMPSLVGIRQGLQELLTLHSESAVAAYDTIQCAATPLLERSSVSVWTRSLPDFVATFEEAAMALQELLLEAKIRPLEELIQDFSREPALLIAAIQKRGFGKGSSGQAYLLWEAFSAAVTATHSTDLNERPWMSIRDFAFNLHARPEFAGAATRMTADLLRFAESLPASPAV